MTQVYELDSPWEIFPPLSNWKPEALAVLKRVMAGEDIEIHSCPKHGDGVGTIEPMQAHKWIYVSVDMLWDEPYELAQTLFNIDEPYREQVELVEEFVENQVTSNHSSWQYPINEDTPLELVIKDIRYYQRGCAGESEAEWDALKGTCRDFVKERGDRGKKGVMQ